MPSATLLFMDVVGYSAEATDIQYDTILDLNREVQYVLYRDFDPSDPRAIALPTGDGMLLALLDDDDRPRPDLAQKCFALLATLYKWTQKSQTASLRYGLHYGPITFVRDINGQRNICGDAVNITARLMSLGADSHIVASADFVHRFIPQCVNNFGLWIDTHDFRVKAIDEVDTRVKHSRRILGYPLLLEHSEMEIGNPKDLDVKYFAEVFFPAISKKASRESTLSHVLPDSVKITFLGFSYQNLPSILDLVGEKCREIVLCIPSKEAVSQGETFFAGQVMPPNPENTLEFLSSWQYANTEIDIKVYEYPSLPPFGGMLSEQDGSLRGFLHLSMYLPDVAPEDTPFMELTWSNTKNPTELYSFYVDYIGKMISSWPEISIAQGA